MPYFEFIGEDASRKTERAEKYWEVTQVGKTVTVRFGKIGADGQLKVKEFETKEDAEAEVAKLIKEKTKKGYIEKPNPHVQFGTLLSKAKDYTNDRITRLALCLQRLRVRTRKQLRQRRALKYGEKN